VSEVASSPRGAFARWRLVAGAAAGYAAFFGLLFLPMALRGEIPGNCDTWLNGIAVPNLMRSELRAAWTGEEVGRPLYPASGVLAYGEASPGTSALFLLFRLASGSDALASTLSVVAILTLNAVGVLLLCRWYVRDVAAAAFAGLAFSAAGYTLGNIDSPHTSFFLVALLCLDQWIRYLETKAPSALVLCVVLGGAQAYFSAYVFFFLSIAVVLVLLFHRWRRGPDPALSAKRLGLAALGVVALAGPFFATYLAAWRSPDFVNPWDPVFLAEVHSLEPDDLLRSLENNVLYPFDRMVRSRDIGARVQAMIGAGILRLEDLTSEDSTTVLGQLSSPDDPKYFVYTRRCAFVGFVLYALAAVGLWRSERRLELAVLYVVALVLSFGPVVWLGSVMLPNLTLPLYEWGVALPLRVPSRAFSFALLALVILAAVGLERVASRPALSSGGRRALLLCAVTIAVLAENVPVPVKSFAGKTLATPEPVVSRYFAGKHGAVLLDLPSRPGGALFRDSTDLFEWNREILYMNHQTYHRQSTVNGVHGYFPRSRLRVQHLIDSLPSPAGFEGLRALGVQFVVYHHRLELPWEAELYRRIVGSPFLVEEASTPDATIFRLESGEAAP